MSEMVENNTLLSKSVKISQYFQMEKDKNKKEIANFIKSRFEERYIAPLRSSPNIKHGFCTMAICCLMIEALESFWQGWGSTKNISEAAFVSFFERNQNFNVFKDYSKDFYQNVRCGILHQAETGNGWLIHRDGKLFDIETKTINATLFHYEMQNSLNKYHLELLNEDWESSIWVNFREKMKTIIANCRSK